MEDNRTEQMEALETLVEFNEKVVKNINILVKELKGARLEDTDKFQTSIINAVNWEIQVLNGTMEILNDGKERVNKDAVNEKVVALGESIKSGDDAKMAVAFEDMIPALEVIGNAAKEALA